MKSLQSRFLLLTALTISAAASASASPSSEVYCVDDTGLAITWKALPATEDNYALDLVQGDITLSYKDVYRTTIAGQDPLKVGSGFNVDTGVGMKLIGSSRSGDDIIGLNASEFMGTDHTPPGKPEARVFQGVLYLRIVDHHGVKIRRKANTPVQCTAVVSQ